MSPSFTAVNYSLRPSKTIQRALVFEGLRKIQEYIGWKNAVYVGFGSIWFTDFLMAHKNLRISKMISMEASSIGYKRAEFNRPYSFVRLEAGLSFDVLPRLFDEESLRRRPWIIWLDYDKELGEDEIDEIRGAVDKAPDNSALLVTFDASGKRYGENRLQQAERLKQLFGVLAPTRIERADNRDLAFGELMATLTSEMILSAATKIARFGGCVPAFKIVYRDKATMVTVGAILPNIRNRERIRSCVEQSDWPGLAKEPVVAPHLTSKEVAVLQAGDPQKPVAFTRSW